MCVQVTFCVLFIENVNASSHKYDFGLRLILKIGTYNSSIHMVCL